MSLLLHDVTLTYPDGDGRLTALDRVSLSAPAGTVTAVVGPSGSGKSSLLAVAATLTEPDSGEVVVDGTSTRGLRRAARTVARASMSIRSEPSISRPRITNRLARGSTTRMSV